MTTAPGLFITLEGIEGCGKSTLCAALGERMRQSGVSVRTTREPGGTPLAEQMRALVLHRQGEVLTPVAETLLMFAARSTHVENLVRPTLQSGSWVLCDRFTDATRAYQGAGRGVDMVLINQLAVAAQGGLVPHRTLLLDVPVETGLRRARSRGGEVDRFEAEDVRFFERVRGGYLQIAAAEPQRVRLLDATRTPDQVLAAAWVALRDLLPAAAGGERHESS